MKKTRQLHLWIGLICSVFILLESITGLLLSEKALFGLGGGMEGRTPQAAVGTNAANLSAGTSGTDATGQNLGDGSAAQGGRPQFRGDGEGAGTSFIGIVKGLHEGRIGQTDVSWLIDLTAIGMIVLTVTGITLSIKTLRTQSVQRKRRAAIAID